MLAYNEAVFTNATQFRPERYIVEGDTTEADVERARNSYWAFATGPRKCPGMKMAYQEMYITIARMVFLFDFQPENPKELESNFDFLDHFSEWRGSVQVNADSRHRCQEDGADGVGEAPRGQGHLTGPLTVVCGQKDLLVTLRTPANRHGSGLVHSGGTRLDETG